MTGEQLMLEGGRQLGFRVFGAADGIPVLTLHGTPGSSLKFAGADGVARRFGLRLICPDRWGYGQSNMPPAPSVALFGDDMGQLARSLGLSRFAVLGISGGGPYALATAAVLGDRVRRLALAGPVGDIRDRQSYSVLHRFCFGPATRMPYLVKAAFGVYRQILGWSPGLALRIAVVNGPRADWQIIADPDVNRRLTEAFRLGLKDGVSGPVLDLEVFGKGLGDLPERVRSPVRIWYGSKDGNVPILAIQRLAERIAGAETVVLPGEGHFWITREFDDVFRWLAE